MSRHRFRNAQKAFDFLEEKAKENRSVLKKLEEGRKLIDERRRKHNVYLPIPPGHDQETWFARLEAAKIWHYVFEYITDPVDVTSAFFACDLFRDHLEQKREMMMLTKAFGVLQIAGGLQFSGFWYSVSDEKKDESRDVLNLRLVSKKWKKSAEEALLVPLIKSLPLWHPDSWRWSSPMACWFQDVKGVDKAIEMLQNNNTCASLITIRLVKVIDKQDTEEKRNHFYSRLLQFLEIYGAAVWGFFFEQNGRRAGFAKDFNYLGLRNLVVKMPNLKALFIEDKWHDGYPGALEWRNYDTEDEVRGSQARVHSAILQDPFPTLPELQLVSINRNGYNHMYHWLNRFLVTEILEKSLDLKAIVLGSGWVCGCHTAQRVWEALKALRLEYFEIALEDSALENEVFRVDFLELRECKWPLKYLEVSFRQNSYENMISSRTCLKVLNNFSDTLVQVCFDANENGVVTNRRGTVVVGDFPNLKYVDLPFDSKDKDQCHDDDPVEWTDDGQSESSDT